MGTGSSTLKAADKVTGVEAKVADSVGKLIGFEAKVADKIDRAVGLETKGADSIGKIIGINFSANSLSLLLFAGVTGTSLYLLYCHITSAEKKPTAKNQNSLTIYGGVSESKFAAGDFHDHSTTHHHHEAAPAPK